MHKTRKTANRKAKDSVFTDLFGDKKYLFELYKTLHPEDMKATVDDIEIITIENVLINGMYNDLGFVVGDKLMVLVECQSTWSNNILIRILLYYADSYHEYLLKTEQDYYRSTKVHLPKPEAYVIFTGEQCDKPEKLVLSKEFFGGQDIDIEVKAKVIYQTDGRDIINQYILFCKIFNDRIKIHGKTKTAVEETIRICQDKVILKDYLEKRKKEVITMLDSLFNEEVIMQMHDNCLRKEAYNEGISQGISRGISQGEHETAKRMIKSGKLSLLEISDFLPSISFEELQKLAAEIN